MPQAVSEQLVIEAVVRDEVTAKLAQIQRSLQDFGAKSGKGFDRVTAGAKGAGTAVDGLGKSAPNALGQVNEATQRLVGATGNLGVEAPRSLGDVNRVTQEMGEVADSASGRAVRGFASVNAATGRLSAGFAVLARSYAAFAAAAAAGIFGANAIRQATAFGASMAEVSTLVDTTEVSVRELSAASLDLARSLGVSETVISRGLYQSISAGVGDAAESFEFLETAARAGVAGVSTTEEAVRTLGAIINAYGLEADRAREVSDQLFTTIRLGVTTFPELAQSIGTVLPAANSYGVEIDEVLSLTAALTKSGFATSESFTALRNAFLKLQAPTTTGQEIIDQYGLAVSKADVEARGFVGVLEELRTKLGDNVGAYRKLFEELSSVTAVLAVTGSQFEDVKDILGQVEDSAGATSEAFAKISDEPGRVLANAFNAARVSAVEFGGEVLKILADVTLAFQSVGGSGGESFGSLLDVATVALRVVGQAVRGVVGLFAQAIDIALALSSVFRVQLALGLDVISQAGEFLVIVFEEIGRASARTFELIFAEALGGRSAFEAMQDSAERAQEVLRVGFATAAAAIGTALESLVGAWEAAFGSVRDESSETTGELTSDARAARDQMAARYGELGAAMIASIQAARENIRTVLQGILEDVIAFQIRSTEAVERLGSNIVEAFEFTNPLVQIRRAFAGEAPIQFQVEPKLEEGEIQAAAQAIGFALAGQLFAPANDALDTFEEKFKAALERLDFGPLFGDAEVGAEGTARAIGEVEDRTRGASQAAEFLASIIGQLGASPARLEEAFSFRESVLALREVQAELLDGVAAQSEAAILDFEAQTLAADKALAAGELQVEQYEKIRAALAQVLDVRLANIEAAAIEQQRAAQADAAERILSLQAQLTEGIAGEIAAIEARAAADRRAAAERATRYGLEQGQLDQILGLIDELSEAEARRALIQAALQPAGAVAAQERLNEAYRATIDQLGPAAQGTSAFTAALRENIIQANAAVPAYEQLRNGVSDAALALSEAQATVFERGVAEGVRNFVQETENLLIDVWKEPEEAARRWAASILEQIARVQAEAIALDLAEGLALPGIGALFGGGKAVGGDSQEVVQNETFGLAVGQFQQAVQAFAAAAGTAGAAGAVVDAGALEGVSGALSQSATQLAVSGATLQGAGGELGAAGGLLGGAVASSLLAAGQALLGAATAGGASDAAGAVATSSTLLFAKGGIVPGVLRNMQPHPKRLAGGGVFSQRTFAEIAEIPGLVEAVVPLPDGRSIPVEVSSRDGGRMGGSRGGSMTVAPVFNINVSSLSPETAAELVRGQTREIARNLAAALSERDAADLHNAIGSIASSRR